MSFDAPKSSHNKDHQGGESAVGRDRRFERLARLVDYDGIVKLRHAHVMIVGLGGVGSWCAEAIVRSGVGTVTLIDFDKVSINNFNRQMPALETTVGVSKAKALYDRLKLINRHCNIIVKEEQVDRFDIGRIFDRKVDFVIDAIDQLGNKCALINYCVRKNIKIVTSVGAGGRLDPTQIRVVDLSETKDDSLARMVRIYLRKRHMFPRTGRFYVPTVISLEPLRIPVEPKFPEDAEDITPEELAALDPVSKDRRKMIMGTAAFVTSCFGMTCASVAVRTILGEKIPGLKNRPGSFRLPKEPPLPLPEYDGEPL
jgi:tRNA A37 threonylcarbamoyladenosine dehydratase